MLCCTSPQYIYRSCNQQSGYLQNGITHAPTLRETLPNHTLSSTEPIQSTSPTQSSQPSTSSISCNKDVNLEKKWTCQLCTYLNWPKALRCTQCQHEHGKSISKVSPNKEKDIYSTPLSINVNIAEASGGCSPNSTRQTTPHSIFPSTTEHAGRIGNNNRNKFMPSVVSAASRGKWICGACTYENWPKSTKCVLCATSRGQVSYYVV